MVWKKGYLGVSASLLLLILGIYAISVYNSEPAEAACVGYDCYYCGDYNPLCISLRQQYNYNAYDYGKCPSGCDSPCENLGDCCLRSTDLRAKVLYGCEICQAGWEWDGSKCIETTCKPTTRTCNINGVYQHYSNCPGEQIIADCADVYCGGYCQSGQCKNPCAGKSCNSPPADYCSGTTRVYYNKPGTCNCGTCSYSTSSQTCTAPSPTCVGNTRRTYTATCSGGSCGTTSSNTACPTTGCSGTWRQTGGCSGGSCYLNNVENCNNYDGWVDTSGCYADCVNGYARTSKNQEYRDYGCSSGSCTYSVTNTRKVACTTGTLCSGSSGWYNTGGSYAACNAGQACTAQNQEYRTYRCSSGSCTYSVTNTQTVYSSCTSCPTTGCSGDTRYYSGTCSSGACTFGSSEDCNNNNNCANSGPPYAACSGNTVVSRQDRVYNDYTCSGGNCVVGSTGPSGNCPPVDAAVESCTVRDTCASSSVSRHYSGTCSGGSCSYSDTTCALGCNSATGQCFGSACSPNPCTSSNPDPNKRPPANTCSSNDRVTYPNPGTCTDTGGGTYSCSYPPTNASCPTTGCSGETRQTGGCSGGSCYLNNVQDCNSLNSCINNGTTYKACSGAQLCDAQNRLLNDYTCSGGACAVASASISPTCPTTYSNCVACAQNDDVCVGNTLRRYAAASCSNGQCNNSYTEENCQYGCRSQAGDDACNTDPCNPNPCTAAPDDICLDASTLRTYASPGTCTNNGGSASCTYAPTSQACQYGCISLAGDDICASNSAPSMSSASLSATYSSYARSGQTASIISTGSDPNSEQVRLRCGSSSGATDLCTSSYAASNPSCSFTNSWTDSVDHNVYCFLEDTPGARSGVSTATLSSDNTGPALTVSRSPSGQLTPGTSVTITATASDARSGVSTMHVVVDGYKAATCSSTTCAYTFSPTYGNHTYYANAYDRVSNPSWAYDTVTYPGPGPNGNGTAPPPGTTPGEGTTPLPPPSPVPGEGGAPCSANSDCRSGSCSGGTCAPAGGTTPLPPPISVNNPPVLGGPITYSGSCRTGSTITVKCSASDPNQASSSLGVKAWVGECSAGNCFPTRVWMPGSTGAAMTYQSGNTFTRDIAITSADGTGIAATCQATDEMNAQSGWGDAYPLCVVNQCQNPPAITVDSIVHNPSGAGEIEVNFSLDRAGQGEPVVRIKPGSQRGGTNEITATQVSKSGNSYAYKFTAQPSALSGIADISIAGGYRDQGGRSCQFSQIAQMTIDTDAPVTTLLCNNAPCSGIYSGPVSMVLNCNDPTTSCSSTKFGIGTPPDEDYSVPRVISGPSGLTTYTINYRSTDAVGNTEQAKTKQVSIYMSPCEVPTEEPTCPSGRIDEEMKMKVALERPTVLKNSVLTAHIFCFLRNKETKIKTGECIINPATLKVTIDKGTPKENDYFRYYLPGQNVPSPSPSTYDQQRVASFLSDRQYTSTYSQVVDNIQYSFSKHWRLPIYTSIFQSEICVEGGEQSGMSGGDCQNYTVTDSELTMDVSFPDLGVTVPRTTDGQNEANFTKTMLINFEAVPSVSTMLTTAPCTDTGCDVDFNFDGGAWKQTTWSDFEQAYIPAPADVASNSFACDEYRTLNVKAVKQDEGLETTVQKRFFVSCEPRLIVAPAEIRLVLSDQPGKVFDVTAINPKDTEKIFEISATTTDPSSYPLPWIRFSCELPLGCEAGPGLGLPNDDYARLTVPVGLSRSVQVLMDSAARSGSFPVTFVGTEGANTFTATGTLLIFAEGLDEFAAWQLAGLVLAVLVILYYSDFSVEKKRQKRSRRRKS